MHSTEEEDPRLLRAHHAVCKGPANCRAVWRNSDQRIARHVNLATGELLHHVFNRVSNWISYVCRVCVHKLHKRGCVKFRLHWTKRGPCWEHRTDLLEE